MIRKVNVVDYRLVEKIITATLTMHGQLCGELKRCECAIEEGPPMRVSDVLRILRACQARRERAALVIASADGRRALRSAHPEAASALVEASASLKRIISVCEMIIHDPEYRDDDGIKHAAVLNPVHMQALREALQKEIG